MDQELKQTVEKAQAKVLQNAAELRQKLRETSVDPEHVWFRNMLWGILNCVLMDYKYVEIGVQQSPYLAAWGRRNLLELKVITEYVLASEENALAFKHELLIDAKEFYEAITKSHEALHRQFIGGLGDFAAQQPEGQVKQAIEEGMQKEAERGPQTDASDAEATEYKHFLATLGLDTARPKRIGDLAGRLRPELKEEFDPMFKICSKIMHRTSFSIASTSVKGSLDEILPFLSNSAFSDVLMVYDSIKKYIEKNGVRPPSN